MTPKLELVEWIDIPGGVVWLAAGGYGLERTLFEVEPFAVGRYPITNAQYGEFLTAAGYANRAWWCEAGWAAKEKHSWTEPRYWQDRMWNRPSHPIVGVSWYEAMAYGRWLGERMGQTVTLPTEQQWQRAAQGDDGQAASGRHYPWGNDEPDETRCNWNRNEDETTPVTQYPAGASPFGVMDMCGNVWEWCLTRWESESGEPDHREPRLLRGGSWSSDSPLSLRVTNRNPKDPNTRLDPAYRNHVTVGFRCVCL
jgi:formylglycine-generating enzyme required for sulfatase activity